MPSEHGDPVTFAGNKFYTAPSMVTHSGPATVSTRPPLQPALVIIRPLATLRLQMESAVTLVLRFPGLLRPDNPLHKPILDLLAPQQSEAEDDLPAAELDDALAAQQAQPQAGVKPERPAVLAAPKSVQVDLTEDKENTTLDLIEGAAQVKRQRI